MSKAQLFMALLLWTLVVVGTGHSQTDTICIEPSGYSTLTGILLVDDQRCDDRRTGLEGVSQWGLINAAKQYSVQGNTDELKKYERRRVTVTGTINSLGGIFAMQIELTLLPDSFAPLAAMKDPRAKNVQG